MKTLTKILLGTATGLGLFLLLTTPEERFKLFGPAPPEPPEEKRPPRPIPSQDRPSFANLSIGTIALLRGGPGLPGQPDIPRGNVTIVERHLPSSELGLTLPWHYTGRSTFSRADILFDERDIERILAVPPSPI